MAFKFETVSLSEARQELATTRESQLAKFCERIVAGVNEAFNESGEDAILGVTLDMLLAQDPETQDWNIKAAERAEGNSKSRAITIDAIARKINDSKDESDVRAVRKNGHLNFVRNSAWTEKDEADANDAGAE